MQLDLNKTNKLIAESKSADKAQVTEILAKARELHGLTLAETASLLKLTDSEQLQQLFITAKQIKEQIYGKRLVIFAPLYLSNRCNNECLYCAFRASNKELARKTLTQSEIVTETTNLINQGHKRLLLVAGESSNNLKTVINSIETIYAIKKNHGAIRRLNVNIAPLTTAEFKELKQAQIGTYQLFQETYDPEVYRRVHISGKKSDYNWRLTALDRALTAGIDDLGIGALFGLADWRFEVLALLQHSQYLEQTYGVGPHTISVPRLEPALGSSLSQNPPHPVTDAEFCKLTAILRCAIPFTGIIMSTRENAELRRKTFELGISQISAGSKTDPGGYSDNNDQASQFTLGDHRPLDEVVRDISSLGYIPSFCTACYRSGRTGEKFMQLAKNAEIKKMCQPNALATFQEYLIDYASPKTKKIGEKLIASELAALPTKQQKLLKKMLTDINSGKQDLYL